MKKDISPRIQRLFWDVDVRKLDINLHAKTIIERVLNNGTLADWRWLIATYGNAEVNSVLTKENKFKRDTVRPQSRRLATLILK